MLKQEHGRLGICLSRGGLTGVYGHIGFIKALHELRLFPCCVLGTSAGSIVGSLYASTLSISRLEELIQVDHSKLLDPISFPSILFKVLKKGKGLTGLLQSKKLRLQLENWLQESCENSFQKTQIPLFIHATDVTSQKEAIFDNGSIADKIQASAAIPFMFEPVNIDNHLYVDGGVTGTAPEELAKRQKVDIIIVMSFIEKEPETNDWLKEEWSITKLAKRIHNAIYFELQDLKITDVHNGAKVIWLSVEPSININWLKHDPNQKTALIEEVRQKVLDLLGREEITKHIIPCVV